MESVCTAGAPHLRRLFDSPKLPDRLSRQPAETLLLQQNNSHPTLFWSSLYRISHGLRDLSHSGSPLIELGKTSHHIKFH